MATKLSLVDVAKKVGVHPSTVSLALKGDSRISLKRREEILRAAKELNYIPNYMAKGLAGAKTFSVGILVPKLRDTFVVDCMGVQERWLRSKGYMPFLVVTHQDPEAELFAIDSLMGRGVDGLIFDYIPTDKRVIDKVKKLIDSEKPISFLGKPEFADNLADTVDLDLFDCGYDMTKYLLELGHRRIAIIVMDFGDKRQQRRLEGYRKALSEYGIQYDPLLVFEQNYLQQDAEALRKNIMSLRDRPTAISAYNDDLAVELILELIQVGYRIPDDVSVTGVNDSWYSGKTIVPLTTYHLPVEEMASSVTEFNFKRIENPKLKPSHKVFTGQVKARQSTSSPISSKE